MGGVLTEVTKYEDITGTGEIVFTNTYKADATSVVIAGTKTLNGRTLEEGEFSFELYDVSGAKLETVANAQDGTFEFQAIPVEEAGEQTFTVKEVKGTVKGVKYDEAVCTVTVTATDNLDGTLTVECAYQKGGQAAASLNFVNTYTPIVEPPKTGDENNPVLWMTLMLVSGFALMATLVIGKKKFVTEA